MSATRDRVDPATRSAIMRAVKGRDTRPERALRSALHRLGFRFRLHVADLPGRPDIVLPGRRAAIFVNGCFWHGHDCPRGRRQPVANAAYWRAKIARNVARDRAAQAALAAAGWAALTVWECDLRDVDRETQRLVRRLTRRPLRPLGRQRSRPRQRPHLRPK